MPATKRARQAQQKQATIITPPAPTRPNGVALVFDSVEAAITAYAVQFLVENIDMDGMDPLIRDAADVARNQIERLRSTAQRAQEKEQAAGVKAAAKAARAATRGAAR